MASSISTERARAAGAALAATVALTVFKVWVGLASGSVGVLSEGIHSFLDLVSAAIAFYTVREAVKPADREHPFGHGKFETLSSLFESLLLVLAAGFIVHEGVDHLRNPHPIRHGGLAIAVIAVSIAVSLFMYFHNRRAAAATESSAIHVNALHFLADVVAGAGVLAGLVVIQVTGWFVVDAIMAFVVAAYILVISFAQVRRAILELVDAGLPESEVALIRSVVDRFSDRMLSAHELRTRRSGVVRHADFHLLVCKHMTVKDSHALCDEIEGAVGAAIPGTQVTIHVEPCGHHACEGSAHCPEVGGGAHRGCHAGRRKA